MNITERLGALLNRANPAFSIADVPMTYGEDVKKSVEKTLNERGINAYDMVARLDIICCMLADALEDELNNEVVSYGVYSEDHYEENQSGPIYSGRAGEMSDEDFQQIIGGQ